MAAVRLPRLWLQPASTSRPTSSLAPAASSVFALAVKVRTSKRIPVEARRFDSTASQMRDQAASRQRKDQLKHHALLKMVQNMETTRGSLPPFTLPMTIVTPPLSKFPRSPKHLFNFSWAIAKTRFTNFWSSISHKVMSMPNFTSRPRFKIRRSAVIANAKALHQQVLEALAAGDKEALRHHCTPELYRQYAAVIDSRPKNQRVEWELVKYQSTSRYPRIADLKITMIPHPNKKDLVVRQAVVSIASLQRLARYELSNGGKEMKVAGSEKTKDTIEHVVIMSEVDNQTSETAPWKMWGTIGETTYEVLQQELKDIDVLQRSGDI